MWLLTDERRAAYHVRSRKDNPLGWREARTRSKCPHRASLSLLTTSDPLALGDWDWSQVGRPGFFHFSNNGALHTVGQLASVESSGLLPVFYEDLGSLETGRGRASWQPRGALAGEGITLPCLHALDVFRACVIWLWTLELVFLGSYRVDET